MYQGFQQHEQAEADKDLAEFEEFLAEVEERERTECYHIWVAAEGGNALFRMAKCYTRPTANSTIRNWKRYGYGGGRRPGNLVPPAEIPKQVSVMRCKGRGWCPCPCTTQ